MLDLTNKQVLDLVEKLQDQWEENMKNEEELSSLYDIAEGEGFPEAPMLLVKVAVARGVSRGSFEALRTVREAYGLR